MKNESTKYVCSDCAGNNKIKDDIFTKEKEKKVCSYCEKRLNCISLDSLAEVVDYNYREDYELSSRGDSPSYIISEMLGLDDSAGRLDTDLIDLLSSEECNSEYKDLDPMYNEGMTYAYKKHFLINDDLIGE